MTRILQNDFRLPLPYQDKGCLYRIVLATVEETTGRPFNIDELNGMYGRHRAVAAINENCGLDSPMSYEKILGDAFGVMGLPKAGGNQVALLDDGGLHYWGSGIPNWDFACINYEANTDDGHFLLGDKYLALLFNPNPDVRIGKRRFVYFVKLRGV